MTRDASTQTDRITFTVQVTYEYIDSFEVIADDEDEARAKWEMGGGEHLNTTPPVRRRVRVVAS